MLAIDAIGAFMFDPATLCGGAILSFARTLLVPFLNDPSPALREVACLNCSRLLLSVQTALTSPVVAIEVRMSMLTSSLLLNFSVFHPFPLF
jgi:hypothetical protein